ncbi:sperm microtubule inner protein 6 isoform X1 [Sorex fumeus]|uniref:sperm microtubule inner protein 6 isoform X1 n=1 Tax=Sorex fumeus TaxID=62283 RepID=UPI0024AE2605|nr:sperm microtubule inner protein 6 isoform X1 [Sorex fumeus]
METTGGGMPVECTRRPEQLSPCENEVMANMLHSLSRYQPLPQISPRYGCVSPYDHRPGMQCAVLTPPPSFFPCPNLKWETSHFKKTSGAEKDNYVIHPEFTSEIYPDGC